MNIRFELWTCPMGSVESGPWKFEGEFSHCGSSLFLLSCIEKARLEGRNVTWINEAGYDEKRPQAELSYTERNYI